MMRWWRRYQRFFDTVMLWPVCRREADREMAERVFFLHASMDPAYSDMTEAEIWRHIKRLP